MATKRIRIAVAVTADGDWSAQGWTHASDEDMRNSVLDCIDPGDDEPAVVYVEADVPVPEPVAIAGEVKEG